MGLPAIIYPSDMLSSRTDLTGYTFIAILFDESLNWRFVVGSPVSSTQIFAYVPILIATALQLPGEYHRLLFWSYIVAYKFCFQ